MGAIGGCTMTLWDRQSPSGKLVLRQNFDLMEKTGLRYKFNIFAVFQMDNVSFDHHNLYQNL